MTDYQELPHRDVLTAIPADLIDYKVVADRLGVSRLKLRQMALRGDFAPNLYRLTAQRWVVSESEVEDWFKLKEIREVNRKSTIRAGWVEAEARKAREARA